MKLFHYSGQKLAVLVPQIGDTRHKGEDEQAIDQPVVWLTDGDSDVTYDKDGNVSSIYRHVVEIDLNGTVYSIGLVHKARFHSALNPTNANKRMMDLRWPVDISAIAHHHVANIEQTTRWEGPYKKEVVLVRTGTYKIKDGYSELEGFGQGQVGGAMVVLFPDTKKMVPFIRIEDGMEYLKLLRK